MLSKLSLRSLLIGGTVIVIFALMTVTTLIDIERLRSSQRRELEEQGVLLGNSLSSVLLEPLRAGDRERIGDFSAAIWAQRDVAFVNVYDGNGELLVGPGEDQFPRGVRDESALDAVAELSTAYEWTSGTLVITAPVTAGASLAGAVQFGFDSSRINDEIETLTLNRIWQTVVLLGIGAAISFMVASYLSSPLRLLARATDRLARGELDTRVETLPGNEMSLLGASFNQMADELETMIAELRGSRQRIVTGQETVRREIAAHLHGPVQSTLIAIRLELDKLSTELERPTEDSSAGDDLAGRAKSLSEKLAQVTQSEISALSRRLYPAIVRMGLVPAMRSLADSFEPRLSLELKIDEGLARAERDSALSIAEQTRLTAYRITEEALTNVLKHSPTSNVLVAVGVDDGLIQLSVSDDGPGFEVTQLGNELGLAAMKDAAGSVGGTCEFRSAPGEGTQIIARLPLTS